MDSHKMREVLMAAFLAAIDEVGLATFKRTSLFMSSRAPLEATE